MADPITKPKSNKGIIIVVAILVVILLLCGMGFLLCRSVPGFIGSFFTNPMNSFTQLFKGNINFIEDISNQLNTNSTASSQNNNNSSVSNSKYSTSTSKTTMQDCQLGCQYLSTNQAGFDGCVDICEMGIKVENGDCESLTDSIYKTTCYVNKAKDQRNPALCEMIDAGIFRDTCYIDLAKELNDVSICDKVQESYLKPGCISGVNE